MFRHYHYLSGSLASTARCYTALYQDKPIAFIAVIHIRMKSRYYRVTRLVVSPDYQGLGVGKRLLNFIAELYTSQTKVPFYIFDEQPSDNQRRHEKLENNSLRTCQQRTRQHTNDNEIRGSLSRKRITSLKFTPN